MDNGSLAELQRLTTTLWQVRDIDHDQSEQSIDNYFVAAGMRSNGIASAGGVGTVIAHWITEGR